MSAILDLMLRGGAIAAIGMLAAVLAHSETRAAVKLAALLFLGSTTAFLLNTMPGAAEYLGAAAFVTGFVTHGTAGFLWLFVAIVFADAKMTVQYFTPAAGLLALGLFGELAPASAQVTVWFLHNLCALGLAAHAAFLIWATWQNDLVEGRRAARGPFVIALAAYVAALSLLEAFELRGFGLSSRSLLDAAAVFGFCVVGATASIELRATLFEPIGRAQASPVSADAALDAHSLERLRQAMSIDEAWRMEGLTIGALARQLDLPEHQLRHLINSRMGYRNFAAYLNEHRIAAAKQMLADPKNARMGVSAVAYAVGFGSLAPFNRAFKESTGATPTEWRARTLAAPDQSASATDQN